MLCGRPSTPPLKSEQDDSGSLTLDDGSLDDVDPGPVGALARGRVLFARADFWAAHEEFGRAWRASRAESHGFLESLVMTAAAFHKLVVGDDPRGALWLLRAALARLQRLPKRSHGIALESLRGELQAWQLRLVTADVATPVRGLPRIEWSGAGLGSRMVVEAVELHRVEHYGRRAILIEVSSAGETGWGECRAQWGYHGAWDDLASGLAPALLSEPVASPAELPLLWEAMAGPAARSGLEAAVWDLWSRLRGIPLHEALGHRAGEVLLAGRAGDLSGIAALDVALEPAASAGYRSVILPALPNAHSQVDRGGASGLALDVVIDLGGAYKASDLTVLRRLDGMGATLLMQPAPCEELAIVARLRGQLRTPLSVGGWRSAAEVGSALQLVDLPAVHIDPGALGLAESVRAIEVARRQGSRPWIASNAVTPVGAATDLAVAVHPEAAWLADLSSGRGDDGEPYVRPGSGGTATAALGPGHACVPDRSWLAAVTTRRTLLRS